MAGFGSDNDVKIKVTVDAEPARQDIQAVTDDIKELGDATAKASNKVDDGFADIGKAAARATALITAAAYAIKKFIDAGGEFNDVKQGFDEATASAGVLSDALLQGLNKATKESISNLNLMAAASKALQLKVPADQLDDLAFAAQKFADKTNGDFSQSFDTLTKAVAKGQESTLKLFGTVQDGQFVIDKFTDGQAAASEAGKGLSDVLATSSKNFTDSVQSAAGYIDSNQTLIDLTREAIKALTSFNNLISLAAGGLLNELAPVLDYVTGLIHELTFGLTVASSVMDKLAKGEIPSLSEITGGELLNSFIKANLAVKTTGETLKIALPNGADKAGKAAKKLSDEIDKLGDKSQESINKLVGLKSPFENGLGAGIDGVFKNSSSDDFVSNLFKFNDSKLAEIRKDLLDGIINIDEAKKRADLLADAIEDRFKSFKVSIPGADKTKGLGIEQLFGLSGQQIDDLGKKSDSSKVGGGLNLADLASKLGFGGKTNGSFFGFDLGDSFGSSDFQASLADQLGTALNGAFTDAVEGNSLNKEEIGAAIGTAVGAAIGAAFGAPVIGAAIGGFVGKIGGQIAEELGKPSSGTAARKQADKLFADIFDADRLSVIVGDQIKRVNDLTFNTSGGTAGGFKDAREDSKAAGPAGVVVAVGAAAVGAFDKDNGDFNGDTFSQSFDALDEKTRRYFAAAGAGFEQLFGVADDITGQIAAVIVNNVGGSLENLQVLVQSTGKSFEDLGDAIFQSFFNGNLGIGEAQANLAALSNLYLPGLPGQFGAVEEAANNFSVALADGKGSRVLLDSLRDIGAETQDLGGNLASVASAIAKSLGLGAESVQLFLQAMKIAGINSVDELVNASNAKLLALAANVQQVTNGETPTNAAVTAPNQDVETPAGNFNDTVFKKPQAEKKGDNSAANKAKQKEEERKRNLKSLAQEVQRVFTASKDYLDITDKVTKGTLSAADAETQLKGVYEDSKKAVQDLKAAQDKYDKAAENGAKSGKLAKLAEDVENLKDKVDGLKKVTVDLSFLKNFEGDLNLFGLAAKTAGVSMEDAKQKIVDAFKAGKLSATDAYTELKKIQDIYEGGIPGAIGDVQTAFSNFLEAGKKGGAFGIDSLKDIFQEAKEKFLQRQSPARLKDFQDLTTQFNKTRDDLEKGIDAGKSEADIKELQERFDNAKDALTAFNQTIPQISFEDLRSILDETQDPTQVKALLDAISKSGIATFDDLQNASDEALIGITAGFSEEVPDALGETSDRIAKINQQLADLTAARTGEITVNYTVKATDAISQSILDAIPQGKVDVVINAGTSSSSGATSGSTTTTTNAPAATPTAKKKTPKVGSLVSSPTNPGKGYTRVSAGVYRYTG